MVEYKFSNENIPTTEDTIKVVLNNGFTFWKAKFVVKYKGPNARYKNEDFYIVSNGRLYSWTEVKSWDFADLEYRVVADGKIVASGFQFKDDAEYWIQRYKANNPDVKEAFVFETK